MGLSSLSIQNFRCFEEEQNIDLSKLTLITGANSSGKSSILYSILVALQSEFPLQLSPNGKYINMGDFKEISYNKLKENIIKISLKFQENQLKIDTYWEEDEINKLPKLNKLDISNVFVVFNIESKNGKYLFKEKYDKNSRESKDMSKAAQVLFDIIPMVGKSFDEKFKKADKKKTSENEQLLLEMKKEFVSQDAQNIFNNVNEIKNYLNGKNFFRKYNWDNIENFLENYDSKTNFISSFRLCPERAYLQKNRENLKVGTFGENYIDQIIYWEINNDKRYNKLVQTMKKFHLLENIKSKNLTGGRFDLLTKIHKKGHLISLSNVGFGISQFLPIVVSDLQLGDNSNLFIAQPEIHLHPSAQSQFGDYIVNQIYESKKNYLIETHSEYFINKIRLLIVKGKLKEEDVKVYFIENKTGKAKINRVVFTKSGQIKDAPKDFFRTYMMDTMEIALNAK